MDRHHLQHLRQERISQWIPHIKFDDVDTVLQGTATVAGLQQQILSTDQASGLLSQLSRKTESNNSVTNTSSLNTNTLSALSLNTKKNNAVGGAG